MAVGAREALEGQKRYSYISLHTVSMNTTILIILLLGNFYAVVFFSVIRFGLIIIIVLDL